MNLVTSKHNPSESGEGQINFQKILIPKQISLSVQNLIENEDFYKIQKLEKYYLDNSSLFRKRQAEAFLGFIEFLKSGGKSGLIKLPTGTGKIFLIKHISKALGLPTMVLVPRINLVESTFNEFREYSNNDTFFLDGSDEKLGNITDQLKEILAKNNNKFSGNIILTYQSLLRIKTQTPELYDLLQKQIGFLVSDEAHRGLGENTKKAVEGLKETESFNMIENDFSNNQMYHLHTTATKILSNKKVEEDIIYEAKFVDVVNDGDLVCPSQNYNIGGAYLHTKKVSSKSYDEGLSKYKDVDGKAIYEKITSEYCLEKEKNGGYLPSVAFCNTTKQVEEYVNYLNSIGVKAIQCTTNKKGTNYVGVKKAEELLENGEADIIVTCSKVGEGWDLPTLRGALWLTPSSSSSRIIQGTGRITRILKPEDIKRISEKSGIPEEIIRKTSQNTIIFSPSSWEFVKQENNKTNTLLRGFTCLEAFIEEGELTIEDLKNLGITYNLPEYKIKIIQEKQQIIDFFKNKLRINNMTELFYNGDYLKTSFDEFVLENGENICFENIIGSKNINFDVMTNAGIKNLKKLGEYLGFSFEEIINDYKFYLMGNLINDFKSLNSGISRTDNFYNTIILGKKFTPKLENIRKLAYNLGFFEEVLDMESYILEYKEFLNIYGVDSRKSLEAYKGSLSIEKCSNIIGEYFSPTSKKHIDSICFRLGFE